jgi:CubicO group peptidase (beta-lactamase class C family)
VKLGDPIGAPFAASGVTYEQLATHTSGLPRMPADFAGSDPLNPYFDETLPTLVKSFDAVAAGLKPAPSTYSNFGFAVLGQAVAGAEGESYAVLLSRRVLQPLGLHDTVLSWRQADANRLAPPHSESGAMKNWDLNAFSPAGALVSTSRDLARLVQAGLGLTPGPLQSILAATMQPHAPGDAPGRQIGLAWQIEQRGASVIIWHNGATGGYHSFIAFEPARKVGVVLLTNQARGLESLGFDLLAGRIPPAIKPPAGPAEKLGQYLGNYPLAPSFIITVTAEGEQLLLQATGQPRLKLQPIAADRYGVQGVDAEVSFERDATGKIAALILHQNGANQRAPRHAPGEKPPAPAEISPAPGDLEACVGRYRLGPAEFSVTHEDAKLMVQLTGQPRFQVFASARDEFFYKVVNAQLSFVRDADGKVVALILHQNGRDQRAAKE